MESGSWDLNCHLHGMLALQTVSQYYAPQLWPYFHKRNLKKLFERQKNGFGIGSWAGLTWGTKNSIYVSVAGGVQAPDESSAVALLELEEQQGL